MNNTNKKLKKILRQILKNPNKINFKGENKENYSLIKLCLENDFITRDSVIDASSLQERAYIFTDLVQLTIKGHAFLENSEIKGKMFW